MKKIKKTGADVEILKTLGVLSTPERRRRSLSKIFKK